MADEKKKEPATKGVIPATGVDVVRRLQASGTGRAKLNVLFELLNRFVREHGQPPLAVELLKLAREGHPGDGSYGCQPIDPVNDGTCNKIKRLIETGSHESPDSKTSADLDFAEKLAALESGKSFEAIKPPLVPLGHTGPRVQYVGDVL